MHYFTDRRQAGRLLAEKLSLLKAENCAVVALSEGGIIIGLEIAKRIDASLFYLATEDISLPGEPDPLAVISSAGTFTYNSSFSTGQLEEFTNDYRQLVDQERLEKFHKLNRLVSKNGIIRKPLLKKHIVILVSDGFKSGLSLDVAADFMKYIVVKKLIVATPISSVQAVDRMHLVADEIYCLGVTDSYFETDHYYEDNTLPGQQKALEMMRNLVFNW